MVLIDIKTLEIFEYVASMFSAIQGLQMWKFTSANSKSASKFSLLFHSVMYNDQ
jgi:hypothetical protein